MGRRVDAAPLVAGLMVVAVGLVLLLDAQHEIDLRFAAFAPIATLVVGATLLASGLSRRG